MKGGRKLGSLRRRPQTTATSPSTGDPDQVQGGSESRSASSATRPDPLDVGQAPADVRSPKEFTGEKLHMEEYPQEGSLRGGHIRAPVNVTGAGGNEDGTSRRPRVRAITRKRSD